MPEQPDVANARSAWTSQTEEHAPVDLGTRRLPDLCSATRSEILGSVGAALLFAAVVLWRFAPERDRVVMLGSAGIILWALATLVRFRHAVWQQAPPPGAIAQTGLRHYREELARRRDHLRNAWIWHGPLVLAILLAAVAVSRRVVPGRIWSALPLVLLLVGWAVIGVRRRLQEAAALEREIEEISRIEKE